MIIECLGVPGSGKSYLVQHLGLPETRTNFRASTLKGVLLFLSRHPVATFRLGILLFRNRNGLLRYKAGLLAHAMAGRGLAEYASGPTVVDEGLLQRLVTLYDRQLSTTEISSILSWLPLPEVVIYATGGDFHRFRSLPNREQSPRVRQGAEAFTRWMSSVEHNVTALADLLGSRARVVPYTRGETAVDAVRNTLLGAVIP